MGHDDQLQGADAGTGQRVAADGKQLRKGQRVASPEDHRHLLQDDGHANGGNQRCQARRTAQGTVSDPFEEVAQQHAGRHGRQHPACDAKPGRQRLAGQQGDDRQRHHRPEHDDFTVGEVDQLNDAVDHRVTERNDGIQATQRQSVDELLQQDIHGGGRG